MKHSKKPKRSFILDIGYFIKEGFVSIVAHALMSVAAVTMIVACLLIMGSFTLLALNMDKLLGDLEAENEFLAYIDESYTMEEAAALGDQLLYIPNVASAVFVSREQALAEYRASQNSNELLDSLPADVLRDRYKIRVIQIEMMEDTVNRVLDMTQVADVSVALEIANGFVMVRNVASGVATILIILLLTVSVFIMSNTIKLATFYRREEIAIMKMCGATNAFVRAPFVVEGLILGFLGSFFSFFLQWFCYQSLFNFVAESGGPIMFSLIPFTEIAHEILKVFGVAGFTIGVGGSLFAIRKFLQV